MTRQSEAADLAPTDAADPDAVRHRVLYAVPVEVVVCVGRARSPIGHLLNLRRDAVIVLDRRMNDPVDICVGDRVVARGELQETDDGSGRLSVRMTEIVNGER